MRAIAYISQLMVISLMIRDITISCDIYAIANGMDNGKSCVINDDGLVRRILEPVNSFGYSENTNMDVRVAVAFERFSR
jgi:hypothetical protein